MQWQQSPDQGFSRRGRSSSYKCQDPKRGRGHAFPVTEVAGGRGEGPGNTGAGGRMPQGRGRGGAGRRGLLLPEAGAGAGLAAPGHCQALATCRDGGTGVTRPGGPGRGCSPPAMSSCTSTPGWSIEGPQCPPTSTASPGTFPPQLTGVTPHRPVTHFSAGTKHPLPLRCVSFKNLPKNQGLA